MGHEYCITVSAGSESDWGTLCLRLGGLRRPEEPGMFEFRAPGSALAPAMPEVTVTVKVGEVWFCDNGGSREFVAVLLRHFLDAALGQSEWPKGVRVAQP